MSRVYNISKISRLLSYTIDDICNLYSNRHLHPQTVGKWIKKGLNPIDSCKPVLIHGVDLRHFLQKSNELHKHHLDFEEFFCMTCKEAHIPLYRRIRIEHKVSRINAKDLCPRTRKIINRCYKLSDYSELRKIFILAETERLYDSNVPLLSTQIDHNAQNQKDEPELIG